MVASVDGSLEISVKTGAEFPRFGGVIILTIPSWFGDESRRVFSIGASATTCKCPDIVDTTQSTSGTSHYIYFARTTDSKDVSGQTLVFRCNNYRNPIYTG